MILFFTRLLFNWISKCTDNIQHPEFPSGFLLPLLMHQKYEP